MSSLAASAEPSPPNGDAYSLPSTRRSLLLIAYFRSGWAFLIPYLIAYLIYALLRWPVNPATAGARSQELGAWIWVPCLLHVYWVLHGAHLMLAAAALRVWWKCIGEDQGTESGAPFGRSASGLQTPASGKPRTADRLQSTGYRLLPWLCLALLFWIPGIYLEWPSDPWEHLRRINEWHIHDQVTAHSTWAKSSYFLPYSLTQDLTGLRQLIWLDIYHTSMCLLLCWQYHRLARAVGLSEGVSFVFVLLNALTFGNNIFSFYRYYGLSSSLFAQLGVVALTRIALVSILSPAGVEQQDGKLQWERMRDAAGSVWPAVMMLLALIALVGFSHPQGLVIASCGVGAIVVFRLIQWWSFAALLLVVFALLLGAAALVWLPRHPALDELYRPAGWVTGWYGLISLSPEDLCFDRGYAVVGALGVVNLAAGVFLIFRGHVAGVLTLAPLVLMSWPAITIPILNQIAQRGNASDIAAMHRIHYAAPACLALVVMIQFLLARPATAGDRKYSRNASLTESTRALAPLLVIGLSALAVFTTGTRALNLLSVPPADLQGHNLIRTLSWPSGVPAIEPPDVVIAPLGVGFIADTQGVQRIDGKARRMPATGAARAEVIYRIIGYGESTLRARLYLPSPFGAVSPYSAAGYLSKHWQPEFLLLEHCSVKELRELALRLGFVFVVSDGPDSGTVLQKGNTRSQH